MYNDDQYYADLMAKVEGIQDLRHVTQDELAAIRVCFPRLLLPYLPFRASNGVGYHGTVHATFVSKGYVTIDNGYRGKQKDGRDFYVMLRYSPQYSQECKYHPAVEIHSFGAAGLATLAKAVASADKMYAEDLLKYD